MSSAAGTRPATWVAGGRYRPSETVHSANPPCEPSATCKARFALSLPLRISSQDTIRSDSASGIVTHINKDYYSININAMGQWPNYIMRVSDALHIATPPHAAMHSIHFTHMPRSYYRRHHNSQEIEIDAIHRCVIEIVLAACNRCHADYLQTLVEPYRQCSACVSAQQPAALFTI